MIKARVTLVLAIMLLLFIGGGLVSSALVDKFQNRYETVWRSDYPTIKAVHEIGNHVDQLNLRYIPLLAHGDGGVAVTAELYEELSGRIREKSAEVTTRVEGLPVEKEAAGRLNAALDNYLSVLGGHVGSSSSWEREHQMELLQSARRIEMLTSQIIALREAKIEEEDKSGPSLIFGSSKMILLSAAGSAIIASLCFWQLGAGIVKPIRDLTSSIDEIKKGNFELSIPVHARDELGMLTEAFNEMASELRMHLLENDEKILKANVQSRAILSAFPHPIFILDEEGAISQVNPKAEELSEELATTGRLPKRVGDCFRTALEKSEDYLPEQLDKTILIRVKEEEFFYLPGIFRIREGDGRLRGWAVVLADVTRLRWMDNMKSNLMATMSHELKTPLTSIRMIIHLLAENSGNNLDEGQVRMVESAKVECENLLGVVDSLLQASRFDSGEHRLEKEKIPVAAILDEAMRLPLVTDSVKKFPVEVRTEDDLPDVWADLPRIRQVIENYMLNAFQYSKDGDPVILDAAMQGQKFVRFSIFDKGVGVPETIHESLFDKFVRGPDQLNDGIGLGLSISREIVGAHGGKVGFRSGSEDESFTTQFYFDLPVAT